MKNIEDVNDEDLMEIWTAIGGTPHLFEYSKDELKKVLLTGSCEDQEGNPIGLALDFYTMAAIVDVLRERGFNSLTEGGIICPFCGDSNFDNPGLKHHLNNYCEVYNKTEII